MTASDKDHRIVVPPLLYDDVAAKFGEEYAVANCRPNQPIPIPSVSSEAAIPLDPNTLAARRLMRKLGGPVAAADHLNMDPRTMQRIFAGKRPASDTLLRQLQEAADAR